MIKFNNPIVAIDIETTGVNVQKDRIVELSVCKILNFMQPEEKRTVKTKRYNPTIPIPLGASAIHGIYTADVLDSPTFAQEAKGLLEFIEGCDLLTFNGNAFDLPMLFKEFYRAGITWDYTNVKRYDAGNIYKIEEPRTLAAAHIFYTGEKLEDAHSAEADILGTVKVFEEQLKKYPTMSETDAELNIYCNYGKPQLDLSGKFTTNEQGDIIFTGGKHKGQIAANEYGYLSWMLKSEDTPIDSLVFVRKLMKIESK